MKLGAVVWQAVGSIALLTPLALAHDVSFAPDRFDSHGELVSPLGLTGKIGNINVLDVIDFLIQQ